MKFYVMKSWPNWKENTPIDMEASAYRKLTYDSDAWEVYAVCSICGDELQRRKWEPPYKVELELHTANFGDVAILTAGSRLMACELFRESFAVSCFTGLKYLGECEVARIVRRARRKAPLPPVPNYYLYSIATYSAVADLVRCGAVYKHDSPATCPGHGGGNIVRYARIVIDESTWDGTDVFIPQGLPGNILVSERFYDWYHSCGFNENLAFIPAEEYSIDFDPKYDVEKYGNGLAFLNK